MTLVVLQEAGIEKTSDGTMEKDTEQPLAGSGSVRLGMATVDCALLENLKEHAFAGSCR